MTSETIEFQAEARQLLQLMIHSIYSTKDVFLRELISNASDALDKLRLDALTGTRTSTSTPSDLHIALETDPAERTLTVRDNGIGMTPRRGRRAHRHDREVRHRRAAARSCARPRTAARPRPS